MSPVCRRLFLLVWLVCAFSSFADEPISERECADGVCVFNVLATDLVSAPCVGYSVLVAYSKASGATLIQCSGTTAAQDNKSFIYDRSNDALRPFEFLQGRFIRPDYLAKAQTQGIPDKFGSVPLCSAKDREAAEPGELLIVEKQPSHSDTSPYCYQVSYVKAGKGSLAIRGDDGRERRPLSEQAAKKWAKLRATLARYIDEGHAALTDERQMGFGYEQNGSASIYRIRRQTRICNISLWERNTSGPHWPSGRASSQPESRIFSRVMTLHLCWWADSTAGTGDSI